MPLHPNLPKPPNSILPLETRWFFDDEELRKSSYEKLKHPLVNILTKQVISWTDDYKGPNETSKALLNLLFSREHLRKQSNLIDSKDSPYKTISLALMLKRGGTVRDVTTIVESRAYFAKNNILPEQTLGGGLCKMYHGNNVLITIMAKINFLYYRVYFLNTVLKKNKCAY